MSETGEKNAKVKTSVKVGRKKERKEKKTTADVSQKKKSAEAKW